MHVLLQVTARLLGHMHLPWEGRQTSDMRRMLGAFQEPVLQLLHREPSQRMTMHNFHVVCKQLFARQATTGASEDSSNNRVAR